MVKTGNWSTGFEPQLQANMDPDLQERLQSFLSGRMGQRFQQLSAQDVQERLERFLSWMLDARWFPETDSEEKKRRKGELRKVRAILTRMKAFSKDIRDVRLQRGLAEWQSYEKSLAELAAQHIRRAPQCDSSGPGKGNPDIAKRILCAFLIVLKLWPDRSVYEEVQRLLADPTSLPYPITVPEDVIQELQAGTTSRPVTASEMNYLKEGRDIPMRRYSMSVKALQSSVARLRKRIKAGQCFGYFEVLQSLYGEYLWSQRGQGGFSDAEAAMLRALVPTDVAT
jgi:hypothetical protein